MASRTASWREWMMVGFTMLALVALLPLLGITLWVLRFVLVLLAAAALVGAVLLLAASGRFREWFAGLGTPEVEYKGLRLARAVGLGRGHSWALVEPDGTFVGADHLAVACLGPVDRVELPAQGSRVQKDEVLFTLARGSRELVLNSPVDGTVVARNDSLLSEPGRINSDPFGLGWVARIRSDEPRLSRRGLLRGRPARDWFRSEVDRLASTLGSLSPATPTLPDGGVLITDVHQVIDGPTWERICVDFFDGRPAMHVTPAHSSREVRS